MQRVIRSVDNDDQKGTQKACRERTDLGYFLISSIALIKDTWECKTQLAFMLLVLEMTPSAYFKISPLQKSIKGVIRNLCSAAKDCKRQQEQNKKTDTRLLHNHKLGLSGENCDNLFKCLGEIRQSIVLNKFL